MKYSAHTYARALAEVISAHPQQYDAIRNRFLSIVKKNGDQQNIKKIVRETEQILVRQKGGRMVNIESARPLNAVAFRELQNHFRKEDSIETVTDPRHIAGVKVTIDGEWMIDATLKGKLRKLFSY